MFNEMKNKFYDSVYMYLRVLRGSGITNLFEIEGLLQHKYNLSSEESRKIILNYMDIM